MKKRLLWKLLLVQALVLLVAGVVLWLAIIAALPRAFERHMAGMGAGMMGRGMGPMFFQQFRDGVFDALAWGGGAALLAAAGASFWLSRRLTAPIVRMQAISERIASGQFGERVPVESEDELGALAASFNRMAAALEETEERRRRLIADVAHELRTPLTGIRGYLEGLRDGVLPVDDETFSQMEAEAGRLQRLVDDLQELSRVEAGAFQLELQAVGLPELLHSLQKNFLHRFEEKGVHLEVVQPVAFCLWGDPARLTQILTNLLNNALRYTPPGGRVTITARQTGEMVEICIADTGVGISEKDLPHIFERFYRADSSRSRRNRDGGSGIGLTIVRHLVEAHGGSIWAESDGLGKGSRFYLRLPTCTKTGAVDL